MAQTSQKEIVIVAFACIGMLTSSSCASKETVVVETKYGKVKGITVHFPHSLGPIKAIDKFLGVPYAIPPKGKLRFKKPKTIKSWFPNVYDATYFHNVCMQKPDLFLLTLQKTWPGFSKNDFSEDCLFLNIHAPKPLSLANGTIKRKHADLYPVMVYFHGGSYFAGTPLRLDTTGEILPLKGVLLVAVQYRLGPFGFLATGDGNAPGNAGILDQVEALKWIKENIKNFKGDPRKVTIIGESAGGASVGLHSLSPLTEGLFQRAIADSGVDYSPFAYLPLEKEIKFSKKLARNLGCPSTSNRIMIKCLRKVDAVTLATAANSSDEFRPVVDGYYLPQAPPILRRQGKFHAVPLLTGFTKDDASFLLRNSTKLLPLALRRDYIETEFIKRQMELDKDKQATRYFVAAIEHQYTPWPHTRDLNKLRKKIIEMYTDYYLSAPTHAVVEQHALKAPVFLYEFRYRSKHDKTESWKGVMHGSNSKYIFGAPFLKFKNTTDMQNFDERDRNFSQFMMTLYTNFAKFGDPTPKPVNNVKWKAFHFSDYAYLKMDAKPEMSRKYHPHRIAFWNHFFPYFLNISLNGENASTPEKCFLPPETRNNEEPKQKGPVICAVNNEGSFPKINKLLMQTVFVLWVWKRGLLYMANEN